MSDLTQTGQTLLLGMINAANPSLPNGPLSTSNVTFGLPATGVNGKNTTISVSGIDGAGYTGAQSVDYDRLDIGVMFTNWAVTADVPNGPSYTNASDLLPYLNTTYNLNVQVSDIVDGAIGISSYPATYTLQMNVNSLTYTGSLDVQLEAAV